MISEIILKIEGSNRDAELMATLLNAYDFDVRFVARAEESTLILDLKEPISYGEMGAFMEDIWGGLDNVPEDDE